MSLDTLTPPLLEAVEAELKQAMDRATCTGYDLYYHMQAYHLGWEGDGAGPEAQGKRLRPLFVLLSTAAAGGRWQVALPAAAAVELVHNFSLIHDDIEDNSPLRRGRETVWKKWGVPQAINAGDGMYALAHLALLRLEETTSPSTALAAANVLQQTCLHLTQGQFLDIYYEAQGDLSLEAYWPMVEGKTAALIAACTEIGALVAGAAGEVRQSYRQFGKKLGLAFQALDDLLGIWGDAGLIGKSTESDLLAGKKSLPVLYGLSLNGPFARRWVQGPLLPEEVPAVAALLKEEGGLDYTKDVSARLTAEALQALSQANPAGEAGQALYELAEKLLSRRF